MLNSIALRENIKWHFIDVTIGQAKLKSVYL